jgi:lipopolysaccharide export LptBFGC system permease protein LptF
MTTPTQPQKNIDYHNELSHLETQFEISEQLKTNIETELKQIETEAQTLLSEAIRVNQQLNELESFSPASIDDKISSFQKSIKEMEKEIINIENYNHNLETDYLKTKGSIFAALLTLNHILSENSQTERMLRKYREQLNSQRLELAVEELMEKMIHNLLEQSAHLQIVVPRRETDNENEEEDNDV